MSFREQGYIYILTTCIYTYNMLLRNEVFGSNLKLKQKEDTLETFKKSARSIRQHKQDLKPPPCVIRLEYHVLKRIIE